MSINPRAFIESVDLGETNVAVKEGVGLNLDQLPEGVVSGPALIDFSATPSLAVRAGVSLAMLFASRVATKTNEANGDEDKWLADYTSNLSQLGFALAGTSVVQSRFKKTGLEVHQAIIPFLTVALGGATVGPVILALLTNLQDVNKGSPWITLFNQTTRRYKAHELHFAAVSSTDTETSIRYAIARLNVAVGATDILFFKLTQTEADFESSTTTMTANNSLLAVIEPDMRARLGMLSSAFIANAKL